MPDRPVIFHNPRCSKSRKALALLGQDFDPRVVRYLESPPSPEELDEICTKLGVEPQALVRTGEARFRELGLSLKDPRTRAEWIEIMTSNPILIERPIVVWGKAAVVGRPPEKVLDLLP